MSSQTYWRIFGLQDQVDSESEGYLGPTNVPWATSGSGMSRCTIATPTASLQLNYWSSLRPNCRVGAAIGPEIYFDTTRWRYLPCPI